MPLNWRLACPELSYIVQDATARVVISEADFWDRLGELRGDLDCIYAAVRPVTPGGWTDLDALADARTLSAPPPSSTLSDLLRLMYTSGTTSLPKGVMLSYGNLIR